MKQAEERADMMEKAMKSHPTNAEQKSERQSSQAAMLEEALRQPGIREIMEVYEDWQSSDHGLDSYRAATKEPRRITTTDRANN